MEQQNKPGGIDLVDLWIFKSAESLADTIWRCAVGWEPFAKNTDSGAKGKIKEASVDYQASSSLPNLVYQNLYDPISQSLILSISTLSERELFTEEEVACLTKLNESAS